MAARNPRCGKGLSRLTFFKSACPVADVPIFNPKLNRVETECAEWRARVMQHIARLKPEAAVLSSYQGQARDPAQWRAGYRRTLQQLAPARVLLINSTPFFPFSIPECLAAKLHNGGGDCSLTRTKAEDAAIVAAEAEAAEGLAHVRVINLNDRLCGADRCEPIKDGQVIYRDSNHVTTSYARRLAGAIPI